MRPEGYGDRIGDLMADYERHWVIRGEAHGHGYRAWPRDWDGLPSAGVVHGVTLDGLAGAMDAAAGLGHTSGAAGPGFTVTADLAPGSPWRALFEDLLPGPPACASC